MRLKAAVALGLNVTRNETDSKEALTEIEKILKATTDKQNCFTEKRIRNDALTAYIALSCAIERRETVGSHVREDEKNNESPTYTLFVNQEEGRMKVEKRLHK